MMPAYMKNNLLYLNMNALRRSLFNYNLNYFYNLVFMLPALAWSRERAIAILFIETSLIKLIDNFLD